jgi:hypothetical protein
MLIGTHSIFTIISFTSLAGFFYYFWINIFGTAFIYILHLMKSFISKTIMFVPLMIPHVQTLTLYSIFAFDVGILLLTIWINVKHYQLMQFIYLWFAPLKLIRLPFDLMIKGAQMLNKYVLGR